MVGLVLEKSEECVCFTNKAWLWRFKVGVVFVGRAAGHSDRHAMQAASFCDEVSGSAAGTDAYRAELEL